MYSLPGNNLSLNSVVDYLWSEAVGGRTKQAYNTGMRCFRTFLALNNFICDGSIPVVDENMLILFVAHCFSVLHLKYGTIKLYLNGIRFHYLQLGIKNPLCDSSPNLERLHTILRAIKRIQGSTVRSRLPITFDILHNMCKRIRKGLFSPFLNIMLEAAFTAAFFGFLRCGEFTCKSVFDPQINLTMDDVTIEEDSSSVKILLKASKTDPFRRGVVVNLFRTGHSVCPVTAVLNYLKTIPSHLKRKGQPFFLNDKLQPLTRHFFLQQLKTVLQSMGLDHSQLGQGHSFRIGAASSCSKAGIEDHLIKTLGRWSSDCYIRYIHTPLSAVSEAQRKMCY